MTSNHRAHQRQALWATVRIVPQKMWKNLKWFLETLTPRYWMFVYELELDDIKREAYEAEQQARLEEEDFVKSFPEVDF